MSTVRDISSLALSKSEIEKLHSCGFRTAADLESLQPIELQQETQLDLDICLRIIESASQSTKFFEKYASSAAEITSRHKMERPIITFSRNIDRVLGGGVQITQLTEFVGVPGIGKTQIGIQLAVDVQIPECFGGAGGEAIYIDTEGAFMAFRVAEVARHVSEHLQKIAKMPSKTHPESSSSSSSHIQMAAGITRDVLLSGIHVFRTHDQTELMAVLHQLPGFIEKNGKIKIVIIDSIAFHFRQDLQDTSMRNRLLSTIAQMLNQYASTYRLAIVVTNHVTTRIDQDTSGISGTRGTSRIVPALGEFWSHCVTNRVLLEWGESGDDSDDRRLATLVKSPSRPQETAEYTIKPSGVRDHNPKAVQEEASKRQRQENPDHQ